MHRVKTIAKKIRQAANLSADYDAKLERAADIYKFDLLTGMVGEFDELQGVMGEKYALLAGEDAQVATSIREHYLPTSADGALPETEIGAVLAMADKLDTILAFFTVGYHPCLLYCWVNPEWVKRSLCLASCYSWYLTYYRESKLGYGPT